jgi:hypothetical protein
MDETSGKRATRKSKGASDSGCGEIIRDERRTSRRVRREHDLEERDSASGEGREESLENQDSEVGVLPDLTAQQVFTNIGLEFNHLRALKGKTEAWRTYQIRLMENFGKLCELMSPKDITELSMKIEENLKTEAGSGHGSPLDECREFLDGPKVKLKTGRPEKIN